MKTTLAWNRLATLVAVVSCLLLAAACDSGSSTGGNNNANSNGNNNGNNNNVGMICSDLCPDAVAVGCANSPADIAECEQGCHDTNTQCPTEFADYLACAGASPTFGCNPQDIPVILGCETEFDAVLACMSAPPLPECNDFCPDVVAVACPNGPTDSNQCLTGCDLANTNCPAQQAAALACAGRTPTFTCDRLGFPTVTGCEGEFWDSMVCQGVPLSVCEGNCPDVVAAGCANGPPQISDCETGCDTGVTNCLPELEAVLFCGGVTPTWTCDASDFPIAQGCNPEHDSLLRCLGVIP